MITTYHYTSQCPWPHILILWCVHGNETAGKIAIEQYMQSLQDTEIAQWSITFAPICNPQAYEQHVRYIDQNLNRIVNPQASPTTYEQHLANHLCILIESADIVVDLHTSHRETVPYVFQDYDDAQYTQLASLTWVSTVLTWRPALYASLSTSDTVSYAYSKGIPWIVVECGDHHSPTSIDHAYQVIDNILSWYGIIHQQATTPSGLPVDDKIIIAMQSVWHQETPWVLHYTDTDLTRVHQWACIATLDSGGQILAPSEWYIVLPYPEASIGDERFYFGIPKNSS